jgi:hypothetical protein
MQNCKIWSCFSTRQQQLVKQLKQYTGIGTNSKILMKKGQDVAEKRVK